MKNAFYLLGSIGQPISIHYDNGVILKGELIYVSLIRDCVVLDTQKKLTSRPLDKSHVVDVRLPYCHDRYIL